MAYSRAEIEGLGLLTGWGSKSRDMSYVAMAESGGDPKIVNSIGCVGLLQINQPVHVSAHPTWTKEWLKNPVNNLKAGLVLYKAAGEKFDGPWLDSRDKGGGGGWGKHVKGSGGIIQTDVDCSKVDGVAKEYCEKGNLDPETEIPIDPNDPGSGAGIWQLASELSRLAQATAKAGNWLADPANWVRIAYVAGGAVLAIAAVNMVARPYVNPALHAVRQVLPVQTVKKITKRSGQ